MIRERTRSGLDAARARGRKGGRPGYKPEDQRVLAAKSLYEDGKPIAEILRILGIKSKATLYRRWPSREALAYNRSIYLMLAVPYTLAGIGGFYCYRHLRRGALPQA